MLVLLPAKTNAILEEQCCKSYIIRLFCLGNSKIIIILLTEVIVGYMVIISINVRKQCFEETLTEAFCSRGFGFHYCSNNILYVFIQINPWWRFGAYKSCGQYVERPWECSKYVERPRKQSLSTGKLVWAPKKQWQPRKNRVDGFRNSILGPTRAFAGFQSHEEQESFFF